MIKTYLINGFLCSGKTLFIKNLMNQDFFKTGEKALLLLCEEGEEEYDTDALERKQIYLAEIDEEKDFNSEYIVQIEKVIHPTRVIVEFNGMWNRKNMEFPWYWAKPIEITLFDASTFDVFSKNMKSLVSEQVRNASMVIFNRCDGLMNKLAAYRRSVRAVNTGINVVFEDKNGDINLRFEEDLPYDITKDEICITDDTYALFYLDCMENIERYIGKSINLSGMVMKKNEDNQQTFIIGRCAIKNRMKQLTLIKVSCFFRRGTKKS